VNLILAFTVEETQPIIMSVLLADGTNAKTVHLSMPTIPHGVAAVGDSVWVVTKGAPTIAVRSVRTGEMTSKIDLLEDGVAIATVGNRVWVATSSNKVYVFGQDGSLLGALQSSGLPLIRRFFVLSPDTVFSVSGGKDFVRWDTAQFTVDRTFFGAQPGETVHDIVAANRAIASIIVATSHTIRCYSASEGALLSEVFEGANALCVVSAADHDRAASIIRMRADGTLVQDDESGTGDESVLVWAAQQGWITVFLLGRTRRAAHFVREKTVACAGVKQLSLLSQNRVCSFDSEGLITIWHTTTYAPIRTFKTTGAVGVSSGATSFNYLAAYVTSAIVWTMGDGKALIWNDEVVKDVGDTANQGEYMKDLERDEIQFLRRKSSYFDSINRLYREKVKGLFSAAQSAVAPGTPNSNKPGPASPQSRVHAHVQAQHAAAFAEIEELYDKAMMAWERENASHEPLPPYNGRGAAGRPGRPRESSLSAEEADFTEYWKQRHAEVTAELESLRMENDNLVALLHQQSGSTNEVEVRRAHHICQMIKDKNELRERERQLSEDVARLRAKLREYNSPLASSGPLEDNEALKEQNRTLREEVTKLKAHVERSEASAAEVTGALKHNQILKQRVRKLRSDLDGAQKDLSDSTAAHQVDIERLLTAISSLQTDAERQRGLAAAAEEARAKAALQSAEAQSLVEKYRAMVDTAERELTQREAVERAAHSEVRNEITMLCESLDDRDKRIVETKQQLDTMAAELRHRTAETQAARARLEAQEAEMMVMQAHIQQLEEVTGDRKQYARTVGELQGRMEMAIEELRRSFTPVQFAESVGQLESRMTSLCALEAQLRQKDDVIAMRDDQIHTLQQHMTKTESQMSQISSVFLHLPKSVEEIELLLVEVDEYRRRLGVDPETQEMVQIRLLELQAKRRAGEPVPLLQDLFPADRAAPGKSAADMERLRTLSESMKGLLQSAAKDDKTGLVRTPAASRGQPAAEAAPTLQVEPPPKATPSAAAAGTLSPDAEPATRARAKTIVPTSTAGQAPPAAAPAAPAAAGAKKWAR
jgi:regulator of replication initiation timing